MSNERITERLFWSKLEKLGLTADNRCIIEEQKSKNPKINNLLKNASKRGGKGSGRPEVIIQHGNYPDLLIVVEAKAEISDHVSATLDRYADYAVDGALLYGSYLAKEFDVICVAVSGQTESELTTSVYFYPKGSAKANPLINHQTKVEVQECLTFEEFDRIIHHSPEKELIEYKEVMDFAGRLHNEMRDYAQLQEKEKPLLVSAIMLALQEDFFATSYSQYEVSERHNLPEELLKAVKLVLVDGKIPPEKIDSLLGVFAFIQRNESMQKEVDGNSLLYKIIKDVEINVSPFMKKYQGHDIIGKFYGEFISYTGGDGKGLGIVLTPKHITEFMVEAVGIDMNSTVLDCCTGTGAFLIAAMAKMFADANNISDQEERSNKIEQIKKKNLVGVELQSNMYAMACANMIFRGDGKSNLYNKDFFELEDKIKSHKPTHAVINPPYSQKAEGRQELDFIKQTLDCLDEESGGRFACIVPMSVAIDTKKAKMKKREALLESHRLDAVLTMPDDVFQPYAGTNTCVMIFTAHTPHAANKRHKTFFGYFKDDGFELTKKGRKDTGRWELIKEGWLTAFENKESRAGFSVCHQVTASEEWCAEAYMETDYSTLTEADFVATLKDYAAFRLLNEHLFEEVA
ncbi:HsdM family class I SAM-dependent methyltransferase [Vibrio astriarenae]